MKCDDMQDTDIVLILAGTKADLDDVYREVDRERAQVIFMMIV